MSILNKTWLHYTKLCKTKLAILSTCHQWEPQSSVTYKLYVWMLKISIGWLMISCVGGLFLISIRPLSVGLSVGENVRNSTVRTTGKPRIDNKPTISKPNIMAYHRRLTRFNIVLRFYWVNLEHFRDTVCSYDDKKVATATQQMLWKRPLNYANKLNILYPFLHVSMYVFSNEHTFIMTLRPPWPKR